MLTTIALEPATRDRLADLKRQHRLRNMDAVVKRLLDPRALSAMDLFAANETAVRAICRRHGIKRLVAHGSRVRGDARSDSDLDLVVSLPPGKSLFDVARMADELSQTFGVRVDLASDGPHLGRLKERIAKEGVVLVG